MVVNTETLAANPAFGKALVGAWYETLAIMRAGDEAGIAARMAMASATDLAGFDAQLALHAHVLGGQGGRRLHHQPDAGRDHGPVCTFSNGKGLMGGDMDAVGIAFPGGKVLGDAGSVKLRFSTST